MKTKHINVQDLSGDALRWAVEWAINPIAKPEAYAFSEYNSWNSHLRHGDLWGKYYALIDDHIDSFQTLGKLKVAIHKDRIGRMYTGKNFIEAACRAIVAAEFGDIVDVPEELL